MSDELKREGLLAKGFGIIEKATMTDPDISITAKGIICLFASLANGERTAFPGRDLILHLLDISKNTYYEALKELTDAGYVEIIQKKDNGKFAHNVYTLKNIPKKYLSCPSKNAKTKKLYATVCSQGLVATGYGLIPYSVMSDLELPIKSKAMFGYVGVHTPASSATGEVRYATLRPKQIQDDLGISESTYLRVLKKLKKRGYLKFAPVKDPSGKNTNFTKFEILYLQPDVPESREPLVFVPNCQNQDTGVAPNCQNQDTVTTRNCQIQDTVFQDTENQDTQNQDTTNTSSTSTSITNTGNNHFSLKDRMKDTLREKCKMDILNILWLGKPEHQEAAELLLDVVAETVCSQEMTVQLRQQSIPVSEIRKLCDQLTVGAVDEVVNRFMLRKDGIRSQTESSYKAYLLTTFHDFCTQPTLKEATTNESL